MLLTVEGPYASNIHFFSECACDATAYCVHGITEEEEDDD